MIYHVKKFIMKTEPLLKKQLGLGFIQTLEKSF